MSRMGKSSENPEGSRKMSTSKVGALFSTDIVDNLWIKENQTRSRLDSQTRSPNCIRKRQFLIHKNQCFRLRKRSLSL